MMMVMVRRRLMVLLIAVLAGVFSTGYFIPLPGPAIMTVLARGGGGGGPDPVCGNGITELGESCDDGNTASGDGCSATCQVEGVGTFVTLAESSLSGETTFPTWTTAPYDVDTTGWTARDVTNFTGCPNMDNTGSTGIDLPLICMWNALNENEYLYFPSGTYRVTGTLQNQIIDMNRLDDNKGIICQSSDSVADGSTVLRWDSYWDQNYQFLFEGADADSPGVYGTPTAWNSFSGAAAGTTVISVASTAGFTVGQHVRLEADAALDQNGILRTWASEVVSIGSGQITIADATLEDFDGGNAVAIPFDPTENFVMQNCTFDHPDPIHFSSAYFNIRQMVGVEITGNVFDGARREFFLTGGFQQDSNADVNISGNVFKNPYWDKATNGYGVVMGSTDRLWFFDNYMQHVTGMAMFGGTNGAVVAFNHFAAPHVNSTFSNPCNLGDGNDCTVDLTSNFGFSNPALGKVAIDHTSHGVTEFRSNRDGVGFLPATSANIHLDCTASGAPYQCCTGAGTGTCDPAYTHCSSWYPDLAGLNGSASCQGSPAGAVFSCIELHNQSSSQMLFARNYCESGIWFDSAVGGPGKENTFYGNWLHDATNNGVALFNSAFAPLGGFGWNGSFGRSDGSPPVNYSHNHKWINNVVEGGFGNQNQGFDAEGDGMFISDNVIEDGCGYTQNVSVPAELSSQCNAVGIDETDFNRGVNITYQNNTQGADVHPGGYTRTPASLPMGNEWPTFYNDTTGLSAPYVGPEMGDPDTFGGCLPAYKAFNGGSC
jgi:cysteine-rich repeat protein